MKLTEIKKYISSLIALFGFEYKGVSCGVDPKNHKHYDMWYGDKNYKASSIEDVMTVPLFNGKCLNEIYNEIEITEVY